MNMWLRFSLRFPIAHVPRCLQIHRYHKGNNAAENRVVFVEQDILSLKKFIEEHASLLLYKNHPPCLHRMVTYVHRNRVYLHLLNGRPKEARARLWPAIRYAPFYPKNYAYLLFTYLPPSAYAKVRRLKRILWP